MYRGDSEVFYTFDRKKSKQSNLYGRGFYFTDSESHASTYGNAQKYYLNITNPIDTNKGYFKSFNLDHINTEIETKYGKEKAKSIIEGGNQQMAQECPQMAMLMKTMSLDLKLMIQRKQRYSLLLKLY